MRKSCLLFLSLSICIAFAFGQGSSHFPNVDVEKLNGEKVNTANFNNEGNPIIVSFWATWCKPCIQELNNIAEVYEEWQEETGVKLIAISIDDARNAPRVPAFVNSKDWPFEVYLDKNSDFKRAMNVVNVPHTFLLNGILSIVYQHNSYKPGDEELLYEEILGLEGE